MQQVRNDISSQSMSFWALFFRYTMRVPLLITILCLSRLIAVGRVCSCFFWRDVRQEAFLIRLYDDDNHFRLSAFFILFFIFYFSQPMWRKKQQQMWCYCRKYQYFCVRLSVCISFSQLMVRGGEVGEVRERKGRAKWRAKKQFIMVLPLDATRRDLLITISTMYFVKNMQKVLLVTEKVCLTHNLRWKSSTCSVFL